MAALKFVSLSGLGAYGDTGQSCPVPPPTWKNLLAEGHDPVLWKGEPGTGKGGWCDCMFKGTPDKRQKCIDSFLAPWSMGATAVDMDTLDDALFLQGDFVAGVTAGLGGDVPGIIRAAGKVVQKTARILLRNTQFNDNRVSNPPLYIVVLVLSDVAPDLTNAIADLVSDADPIAILKDSKLWFDFGKAFKDIAKDASFTKDTRDLAESFNAIFRITGYIAQGIQAGSTADVVVDNICQDLLGFRPLTALRTGSINLIAAAQGSGHDADSIASMQKHIEGVSTALNQLLTTLNHVIDQFANKKGPIQTLIAPLQAALGSIGATQAKLVLGLAQTHAVLATAPAITRTGSSVQPVTTYGRKVPLPTSGLPATKGLPTGGFPSSNTSEAGIPTGAFVAGGLSLAAAVGILLKVRSRR